MRIGGTGAKLYILYVLDYNSFMNATNGKGDKTRPRFISREQWEKNHDKIFREKSVKRDPENSEKR